MSVVAFFGLGTGEIALVVLLVLLLFGADKIPDLARSLGRAQARFSSAREEVVETIRLERAGLSREQVEFERAREHQMREQARAEVSADSGDRDDRGAPPGDKAGR